MTIIGKDTKSVSRPRKSKAEKIISRLSKFNENSQKSLLGYSVSMNTQSQNWHREAKTTDSEAVMAINNALKYHNISIQAKDQENKKDKDITFYLAKEKGNYRSEIAACGKLKTATKSSYSFDFKATSLPDNLIFFQVRELGGSMKTLGRDRPVFSLHIQQNGELVAVINTVNQHLTPTELDTPVYQRYKIALSNKLELEKYYNIAIKIIMHREQPSITISIDNQKVFQWKTSFGALDSKTFYSKLGAYIPQQKNKAGSNDTEVSFDNFKEKHYHYQPQTIIVEDNLLPNAIAAFNTDNSEVNINPLAISSQSMMPKTAAITPSLLL